MDKHLHIVCFDVPYPANHGGIFDLFYKIVALYKQHIKIHLHCFEYGRGRQDELNKYCAEVIYYKRNRGLRGLSFSLPYIVNSRKSDALLANLKKDNHPVLLEGIHCTYLLYKNKLPNKKVFIRLHNVEFEYYRQLFRSAPVGFKKVFFWAESLLLKKYEHTIAPRATLIAVALPDIEIYEKKFQVTRISYLPVFLPYVSVNAMEGKGSYCLYHGNLAIAENEKAVKWLLENVFHKLQVPFVIAGKNPSKKLSQLAHKNDHTCLVANPGDEEMMELISKAHINILPSFNITGIKIKLLNALFNGRHCIVNTAAVDGTGLDSLCYIANDGHAFKKNVLTLSNCLFTDEDREVRKKLLLPIFDNEKNARQLIHWIY